MLLTIGISTKHGKTVCHGGLAPNTAQTIVMPLLPHCYRPSLAKAFLTAVAKLALLLGTFGSTF